ncbi:MAG: hypothetical protein QMD85_00385 [Candidatus Aenigmarchaeota archaeon]|nr:hypothetical protein [Candidatus Aenigmarchaeota archaeon]
MVGIIYLIPHILMPVLRGDNLYSPLVVKGVFAYAYDQTMYASGIRDVMDGHLVVRDPTIFENKDKVSLTAPLLPTLFLGAVSLLIGIPWTFIIGSFVFTVVTFLLVYFLFHRVTGSKRASILAGCFILIGLNFILTPPLTLRNITFHVNNYILYPTEALNYFNRLPGIQLVFPMLMMSVIFLYLSMESRKLLYSVLCGISLGILAYSYSYYWLALFIALGILFLHSIYRKDMPLAKNIILIGAIGFVISVPYLMDFASFRSSPEYFDMMSRLAASERFTGLQVNHAIKYSLIYLFFLFFVRRRDNFFWLITAVFVAGIIGLNMQVITGFNIQGDHYDFTFLGPLSVIIIIYTFREISMNSYKNRCMTYFSGAIRNKSREICLFFTILLLAFGFYSHTAFAVNSYKDFGLSREYREAYDWINKNTPTDSVVATMSTEQNLLLVVYAHNNVFIPNGFLSASTDEEILDRMFTIYKIFNMTPEYLSYLMDRDDFSEYTGVDKYPRKFNVSLFERTHWRYPFHFKFGFGDKLFKTELLGKTGTEETYRAMLDYYRNFTPVKTYRMDYILVSDYERSIANFTLPYKIVWSNSGISIYKI